MRKEPSSVAASTDEAPEGGSNDPLVHTRCAICESDAWDREVYPANLPARAASYAHFSARRAPDRVHYRVVRCEKCGLLRSDPIFSDEELLHLYAGSSMTYGEEAEYAGETYERYLRQFLPLLLGTDRLLEIGCGSGFFLKRARQMRFSEVCGVEPSQDAVAQASPAVRGRIVNDIFRDGLFAEDHFDVVCAFQVMDHLAHPNETLQACGRVLRRGGLALFIHHDAGAWTHRLLGERSPIIDVEHIYLYDQTTMRRIFEKNGFEVLSVFAVKNSYPLQYWCKMAPFGGRLKRSWLPKLERSRLGKLAVALRAGNLGLAARFPG